MGVWSNLFNKLTKTSEENVVQNTIQEPVVEVKKELTQEEKDNAFLWALCDLDQKKALEMLAAGANPNYERRDTGSAVSRFAYEFAHPNDKFDAQAVFKAAIKAGLDLNKKDRDGLTAIARIAGDGLGFAAVEKMMQLGHGRIDYDIPVQDCKTTGEYMESHLYRMRFGPNNWRAMEQLGDKKRDDAFFAEGLDEISSMVKSWKMLHAVMRGDQAGALKMLNEGANPNVFSIVNGTLVEQLARTIESPKEGFDPKVVFDAAVDKGLDVNEFNGHKGYSSVISAIERGISERGLKGFLNMAGDKVDMNATDKDGKTLESYMKSRQAHFAATVAKRYGRKVY
ncbi:MAG: hypothetical protein IKV03_03135 [Alphaproteobacteria bacterium]|nr:hypothetical protein [Alphaproteobacteria bacterium]